MLIFLFFLAVVVIGAFVICYIPAVVCVLLTVKLGPSGVTDALRSAVIVMLGVNSALNPIVYMLRSNEIKHGFRNLFRGASAEYEPRRRHAYRFDSPGYTHVRSAT